jgi:hypothetical protein
MAEVPVHPGLHALVDDADLHLVAGYRWRVLRTKGQKYAQTMVDRKTILMHRLIVGGVSEQVDHVNRDGLDNRRANLRPCTHQQNCFNKGVAARSASGLKGVRYEPGKRNQSQPWRVRATLDGKRRNIGRFATPEAAHAAYKAFVAKHHGAFACA